MNLRYNYDRFEWHRWPRGLPNCFASWEVEVPEERRKLLAEIRRRQIERLIARRSG